MKNKVHPLVHEREKTLSKIYDMDQMIERWKKIKYSPQYSQLKLKI